MRVHPLAPVVAIDIDGTIGDYYEHFRWFAELYLQRKLEIRWDFTDTMEFSDALGLTKEVYRDIKLAYRQGGMKRCLPVFEGTKEMVASLRGNNIQVWICTTRPWQRLDNIDPDTQFWIQHNVGRVDGVIYGEDKYLDLVDIVGKGRIVGVVDDLPENVVAAQSLGLRAAIRAGGHNEPFRKTRSSIPVAHSSNDIKRIFSQWYLHDLDREGDKWARVED